MTDPGTQAEAQKATKPPEAEKTPFEPALENRDLRGVLESHLGEIFLIANPESFEESSFGHKIQPGWYKAKLTGLGHDYLVVLTEFQHGSGKKATKEPVKQYIPIERIKRLSFMKSQRLIHL